MKRAKKEPVGWIGPAKGRGSGTSLGKGRWRVIDSTGQWIASGFTTQAYALRWIDSFNLLQEGYELNDEDRNWLFLHWYYAPRQRKRTRSPSVPIESDKTVVRIEVQTEAQRPLETAAIKSGQV